MDKKQVEVMLLYISVGVKVLTARAVLILTLLLNFGLFSYAAYWPTYERIACAVFFALLVFLPVIRLDGSLKREREVISPKDEGNGQ